MQVLRLLLFLVLLGLIGLAALLFYDVSDSDVRRAVHDGSTQLQKDVDMAGKVAAEKLGEAVKTFNDKAAPLQNETRRLRNDVNESVAEKKGVLGEKGAKAQEELKALNQKTDGWTQKANVTVKEYLEAARQRIKKWIDEPEKQTSEN